MRDYNVDTSAISRAISMIEGGSESASSLLSHSKYLVLGNELKHFEGRPTVGEIGDMALSASQHLFAAIKTYRLLERVRKIQSPHSKTVNVQMEAIVLALMEAPEQTSDLDGLAYDQSSALQYLADAQIVEPTDDGWVLVG